MRTFKIVAIATISMLSLGFFLYGRDTVSIFDTVVTEARQEAQELLTLDFQLDMVKNDLTSAEVEVSGQVVNVAKLEVAREELNEEIGSLRDRLRESRNALATLTEAYEATGNGLRATVIHGVEVQPDEVASKLQQAGKQVREFQRSLEMKSEVLRARDRALPQARRQLNELRNRRSQIAMGLESAQMDLECVRLLDHPFLIESPETHIAAAEKRLKEIGREIRVRQATLELGTNPLDSLLEGQPLSGGALAQDSRQLLATLEQPGR